jgi:SAM-dependent methyltransferase
MTFLKRARVDNAIDNLRFRLDKFPAMGYQPLPWLGVNEANRSQGTLSRWESISSAIADLELRTALDIGCNVGFYTISLAKAGIATTGIEGDPQYFRMFMYAVEKLRVENVGCLFTRLSPTNVGLIPHADCVLFMSVWHHFVRYFGLDAATAMTRSIWARTNTVLFFETGANEMPARFGLPDMGSDPVGFLTDYLSETCEGSHVDHLGKDLAFTPDGTSCLRDLFALKRT